MYIWDMTERKVTLAMTKITKAHEMGCLHEALLRQYLLNVELLRYIVGHLSEDKDVADKKLLQVVKQFCVEVTTHPELRIIIHPRNLKAVKPWAREMNGYFKGLKQGHLVATTEKLIKDSQVIFTLLHHSASKLFLSARQRSVTKQTVTKQSIKKSI